MKDDLHQRLAKGPPTAPRCALAFVNWACMFAAAFLLVSALHAVGAC